PSPRGRGAGGEGETLHKSGFHVNLTPLGQCLAPTICRLLLSNWYKISLLYALALRVDDFINSSTHPL
ncbi:uroporphyrinogen-III synthase, partial [Tolypothrix sp. PCC 7601]